MILFNGNNVNDLLEMCGTSIGRNKM